MKPDKILKELLHKEEIQTEEEFVKYYFHSDEMANDTEEDSPVTLIRIHFDEGYCQIKVKENLNCGFNGSVFGIFKKTGEAIPIEFFNHEGEAIYSLEDLYWNYLYKDMERQKHMLMNQTMTIEVLDSLCDNADQWNEGMDYTRFLNDGCIFLKSYDQVQETFTLCAYFDVLDDYNSAASNCLVNKNTRVQIKYLDALN